MRLPILAGLLSILTLHTAFAGGGWPQPKGKGYIKLSQSILRSRDYFAPDGSILPITTTSVYSTALYGEYGLTDRLTGLLYAPLFVRSTINRRVSTINGGEEPGDAFDGPGDLELGLKYGLITEGPVVLAASLWLHLPLGENVGGATELLQTGDGAFSQLLQVEASHSFYPAPFYASLGVGFRNRGTATFDYDLGQQKLDYSDEFRWNGEVGWTPNARLLFALKWQQVVSLKNGGSGGQTGNSSLFGNNVAYFSITPEVSYTLPGGFGLGVAVGTAVSGRNILAAPNIGVGIHYTF